MAGNSDILRQPLLDRLADELQPVRRLWSVRTRLVLLMALEAALLSLLFGLSTGHSVAAPAFASILTIAVIFTVGILAAGLALREAVPGRGSKRFELILLVCAIGVAAIMVKEDALSQSALTTGGGAERLPLLGWVAMPVAFLFTANKRGVTLNPLRAGFLSGVAALCFGVATDRFVALRDGAPCSTGSILSVGAVWLPFAILAGRQWLDPEHVWRDSANYPAPASTNSLWLAWPPTSLVLLTASLLLFIALSATHRSLTPVSELDLAVDGYQRGMTGFTPNVPSGSVGAVLTAYIEHGMPSYMWDFGPAGFKLVGGRLEKLPDGTPISFTLFRHQQSGVMCIFKPIQGFVPPRQAHDEQRGMLFYRYRGYSVCLINLGNYGSFVSLIVSPLPLRQFEDLVVAGAH